MCVVSMVYDHFSTTMPAWPYQPAPYDPMKVERDKCWIEDFKKALEAAKTVDQLTGQPDCADPEKAELEAKIARLEKVIDALLEQRKHAGDA